MRIKTASVFVLLTLFLAGSAPAHFALAADGDEETASQKVVRVTTDKNMKSNKITIACKPGSKVTVRVDEGSGKVGDVVTICGEGGEAVVDIGSKVVAPGTKHGDISTHYETGSVTTVTGGKGSKSSVNIGSVKIGQ